MQNRVLDSARFGPPSRSLPSLRCAVLLLSALALPGASCRSSPSAYVYKPKDAAALEAVGRAIAEYADRKSASVPDPKDPAAMLEDLFRPVSIVIDGERLDCVRTGGWRRSVPDGLEPEGRRALRMNRLDLLAKAGPFRGRSAGPLGNRMDVILQVLRSQDQRILDATVIVSNFEIPADEAAAIPEKYLLRGTATIYPAAIESLTIAEAAESNFRRE